MVKLLGMILQLIFQQLVRLRHILLKELIKKGEINLADLSKIKLNGTTYDLKDAVARAGLVTLEPMANVDAMLTSFGLSTAGDLVPAVVGVAETDKAVV